MATKKGIDLQFSIAESEALASIRNLTSQISSFNKELNLTNTVLKNDNASIEDYKNKLNVLNKEKEVLTKKVEETNKMLEKARESYGENSNEVQKWKNKLIDAKTEQQKVENQIQETTKAIDDFGEETEEATKKTSVFGDVLKANLASDLIVAGLKKTVDMIKTISSSVVDLTKKSIENYAEYEQLVGGVETLFGKSSDKVMEYANNAYKTAGLSANKYMETVTSFSASLLQSLDGDTEKATSIADMAITDMADNANKMGTSIEMIQNAYQGFAKQNYTMLDNLKLGYGGTKSEMERLLQDATKISGVKYDIKNLKDVYEAIHVIQTELGITGTTAKEASTTISGSISSMKSSWQNFMTGLANGNANLTGLINNLVDSVLTVADNLIPVIQQVADSIIEILPVIIDKIIEYLPQFLETGMQILTNLINGLTDNMQTIMNAVVQIINILTKTIVQSLPTILQAGIIILVELVKGISQSLPELIPAIIEAVLLMVETLIDNIDLMIDAGIQLIIGLAEGLINALPLLIDKIPVIIDKLIDAITNNSLKMIEMGITIIIKLAEGLIKAIPQLISKIPEIITSIVKGLTDGIGKISDVGKNLVQGLWNGINDAKNWILDKIKGFGDSILKGIKSFFGIKSPSTVFREEIGLNLGLGVAEGIEDSISAVNEAMGNLQNSAMGQIEPSINIGEATSNGVELGVGRPLIINIAEFNNNREQDIEVFAEELAFVLKQKELV